MQIKWNNLIALGLVLATVIVLVKAPALVDLALLPIRSLTGSDAIPTSRSSGRSATHDELTAGLIALSLICVTIVGVARLLVVHHRRRDD